MNNHITRSLKFGIPALVLVFGAAYAFAWTGPTQQPPAGNVVPSGGASLPTGTSGQTLRHDGTNWVANSIIFNNGTNVGIGNNVPQLDLSVGGALFGLQKGDASPNAGYLRFGDGTGWKYIIGRAKESPAGAVNTTTTGALVTVQDNGNVGIGTTAPNRLLEILSGNNDAITFGQDTDNTNTIQTYIDGQWSNRASYASGCCNVLKLNPDVGTVQVGSSGNTTPGNKLSVVGGGISLPTNGSTLYLPEVSANTSFFGMMAANGLTSDGVPWYMGVGREPGGWPISPARATMPYPQLVLQNHTGIRLTAHGGYGGVSIYEQLNAAGTDWISTGREVARFRDAAYGGSYFNGDIKVNSLTVGRGGGNNLGNTAIGGNGPLSSNAGGYENTAVGNNTLFSNTWGYLNTAVGSQSLLLNSSGAYNTAIGTTALKSNSSGNYNVALGSGAAITNSTGSSNTATGVSALASNSTGSNNTAVGNSALVFVNGSNNTAVGYSALGNNTSGSNNTAIGANTLFNSPGGLTNATAIGYGAIVPASNLVRLGNSSVTYVSTAWNYCSDNYGCMTSYSDERLKKNIKPIASALSKVMELKPVTFNWNETYQKLHSDLKNTKGTKIGFIAQDVQKVYPELVNPEDPNGYYTLDYEKFAPILTSAVQELKKENDQLKADNAALLKRVEAIEKKLSM